MAGAAAQKLSPAERAVLFSQSTRKYWQKGETLTFSEGNTLHVTLPKTRFLSNIYLLVKGTYKAAHATKTSGTLSVFERYNLLKQVRLNTNGALNPYQLSGGMLHLKNLMDRYKNVGLAADTFGVETMGNTVSAAGVTNNVEFIMELPLTINPRDTVGIMLLQNDQTVVTLEIDCGYLKDMFTDTDLTLNNASISITPIWETFSIPANANAVPDYSILKIVNQQIQDINSSGVMDIKLPTSLTYRKLFMYLQSDAAGTPITMDKISSIQLIFNQADSPINVPIDFIAWKNKVDYQGALPAGCYALDWSEAGIANLAGARDYVDTERLTECWLRITFNNLTGTTNTAIVVAEKLAKLV